MQIVQPFKKIKGYVEIDVQTQSIDNFCLKNNINCIDLLKLDTEGNEFNVLKGAEKILAGVQYIMIELNNNSKRYGSSNIDIETHLAELGYKVLIKTWPDIVYFKS